MTNPTSSEVKDLRNQIAREYREIMAEVRVRCMILKRESSLAEYRARRAAELVRWSHWSPQTEWAIAEDRP